MQLEKSNLRRGEEANYNMKLEKLIDKKDIWKTNNMCCLYRIKKVLQDTKKLKFEIRQSIQHKVNRHYYRRKQKPIKNYLTILNIFKFKI